MYLMYYLDESGKRVYTLKVQFLQYNIGLLISFLFFRKPTLRETARFQHIQVFHKISFKTLTSYDIFIVARFSPEDKYSKERLTIKKRFNLLLTQKPEPTY